MTYTVVSGNTDQTAGNTPVSVVLDDGENTNAAHTTLVETNALVIDANAPAATTSVTGTADSLGVGDTITLTIVASETSLTCSACTMNGGTLTSFAAGSGTTYTAVYTVAEGQTDRNAAASNFISIVLHRPVRRGRQHERRVRHPDRVQWRHHHRRQHPLHHLCNCNGRDSQDRHCHHPDGGSGCGRIHPERHHAERSSSHRLQRRHR